MATGILYGVGTGPGDPELITRRAWRLIETAHVIAYPAPDTGDSFARAIASDAIAENAIEIPMVVPMRTGRAPAQSIYDTAAGTIATHLDAGSDVVVLCEGDPLFYGSFMYLLARLKDSYDVEIIPGVTSLTACAAAHAHPLVARNDILTILPGPLDVPPYMGFAPNDPEEKRNIERKADDNDPFSGLAFKIMNDPFVGSLTFMRLYSGSIKKGDTLLNSTKDKKERVGRMMMMHSNNREEIEEAFAGDIVALAGMKDTTTGDTMCDPNKSVVLETMTFPDPVIEIAVEPKSKNDQEKMSAGLQRLAAEDPSFQVSSDIESGQTIMRGMGELHLDILVDRLKREFKVEANIGAPQVAYRETITKEVEVDYTHKKQSGGSGQFARVKIRFAPLADGGFAFGNSVVGGSVPKEYVPGVEKGITLAKETGTIAGFPVIDFEAELIDGASHDVDSSVLAFEIAGRAAFREAMNKASPKLLEPVMKVEVITPEEYMGDIIGYLNSRRGNVGGMNQRGNARAIDAMVPLANMFGYINTLRSMSQGRAQYSMQFDHYEQVPQAVADEVRAKMA